MFDRIMENSMAIWILVSATYPIFLFGMIFKAFRHYRRLRALPGRAPMLPVPEPRTQSGDWVPTR
jgi:hypothetical protein